jgi:salicylate hydroxylase
MEDAAVLGRCLAGDLDLAAATQLYEKLRKERAYKVQDRSALNGRIWHCEWQYSFHY